MPDSPRDANGNIIHVDDEVFARRFWLSAGSNSPERFKAIVISVDDEAAIDARAVVVIPLYNRDVVACYKKARAAGVDYSPAIDHAGCVIMPARAVEVLPSFVLQRASDG